MKFLENKVAIVTGGSRGIGRATALCMAQQGAKIVVSARDAGRLNDVVRQITAAGGEAVAATCDLASEQDIGTVVQTTLQTYGRIDILANIGQGAPAANALETVTADDVHYPFVTGPVASMLFMQACFPHMKKEGSAIVNISSRYCEIGGAGFAAFGMAKAATEALTHMAAVEWGKYGIRTNCVRPIAAQDDQPKIRRHVVNAVLKNKIPLGYLADPHNIASFITFLASDFAGYLNGEVICLDGGLSKCSSTN